MVARQVSSEARRKTFKKSLPLSTITIEFYAVCLVRESDAWGRIERGRHLCTMTARTSRSSLPSCSRKRHDRSWSNSAVARPKAYGTARADSARGGQLPLRGQRGRVHNVVVFITGNLAAGYGHFGNVLNHEANGV